MQNLQSRDTKSTVDGSNWDKQNQELRVSEPIIAYRGTVYPWQCDHMGHMNSMWYVGKFDEASWQFLASLGLTKALFREQGAGMVAVEQIVEYKRELYAGDIVSISSAIVEVTD